MNKEFIELKKSLDGAKVLGVNTFPLFYHLLKEYKFQSEGYKSRLHNKSYLFLYSFYKYYITIYFLIFKLFSYKHRVNKCEALATINGYASNRYVEGRIMDSYLEPLMEKSGIDTKYVIDDQRNIKSLFLQEKKYMPLIIFLPLKDIIKVWKDYRLIRKHISKTELDSYLKKGAIFNIVLSIHLSENLLKKTNPKLVLVSCEYTLMNESIVLVSKERKIPTLGIQHGLIVSDHLHYIGLDEEYMFPEYFITYSYPEKAILDNLIKRKIFALGKYQYDALVNFDVKKKRTEFCKSYSLNPDKKIVLFHSQNHGFQNKEETQVEMLFNFFKDNKDFELLIKLHPIEDQKGTLFRRLNNKLGTNFLIFDGKQDNAILTLVCDYEISLYSTVTYDALIMGKIVTFLDVDHEEVRRNPFVKQNIGPLLKNTKDLEYVFNIKNHNSLRKKYHNNIKKFIEKNYLNIGTSTTKHIDLIKKIISNKPENAK